jgi:hypothetical protein
MLCCALLLALLANPGVEIAPFLARLSEEAEAFRRLAPQTLSQETWHQKALVAKRRLLPRLGKSALQGEYHYVSRNVVSEYGFATFKQGPEMLHEFRQVVSVDGKATGRADDARRALTLGLLSSDDRLKKRMLEDFRRLGVVEPAVDFGQILLLFTRRALDRYAFRPAGKALIGAEPAVVYRFEQTAGDGTFTVFAGREMRTVRLRGHVWSRASDFRPLRIAIETVPSELTARRDEAQVEYAMSPHGVLLPASVLHRAWDGDLLLTENHYQYAPFRRFAVDAEIKFTEVPALEAK